LPVRGDGGSGRSKPILRGGVVLRAVGAPTLHKPCADSSTRRLDSTEYATRAALVGASSCVAFVWFRAGFYFRGVAQYPLLALLSFGVTPQAVSRHGKNTWYKHSLQGGHLRIRQSWNCYPAALGPHPMRSRRQDSGCGPRMGAHNPASHIGLRSCAHFSRRPQGSW
jgi:hypothetical protein